MKHAEVAIARQAVEEGRGLVVIVNKMDLLKAYRNTSLHEKLIDAVPKEIQLVIPQVSDLPIIILPLIRVRIISSNIFQVTGVPVVFIYH